jgi:hypothetical protein
MLFFEQFLSCYFLDARIKPDITKFILDGINAGLHLGLTSNSELEYWNPLNEVLNFVSLLITYSA